MRRVLKVGVAAFGVVVAAALAATLLPPVIWPDAPAPASVEAFVAAARQDLWNEGTDGLRLPLHLSFIEARCAADGSVALIFEEHRPPYTKTWYAYVARGSMPTAEDQGWGGGFGIEGPALADREFIHVMGPDPAPCE